MTPYQFLSVDLLTGKIREAVPLRDVKIGRTRNGRGSFYAELPSRRLNRTTILPDGIKYESNIRGVMDPGRTAIYVLKHGVPIWDGILWTAQVQTGPDNQTVNFGGSDFWSYFEEVNGFGRYLRHTMTWEDEDQLQIARDLLEYAQNTGIHGPNADIQLEMDDAVSGVLRSETIYGYERRSIGDIIRKLADRKNGFEFRTDVVLNGSEYQRRYLSAYPRFESNTEAVFELGVNILSISLPVDGIGVTGRLDAIGAGEGDEMLIATSETDIFEGYYPLRESIRTYKDVSIPATLQDHADRDLLGVMHPREIPTLIVRTDTFPKSGRVTVGDRVRVVAQSGYININSDYYVQDWELRIDEDGSEEMTMRFIQPRMVEDNE